MKVSARASPGLKVLQVLGSLDTGGAETMVLSAAEALADACAMDFLVFGEHKGTLEARATATGGRVLRLPSPRDSGPAMFVSRVKRLLMTERYEVVHSHINLASGLVMKAAHDAAVPVRVAHSHWTVHPARSVHRRVYRWFSRRLISRYSTVLAACGEEAGQNLFQAAWSDSRGIVIPNGVELDKFVNARDLRVSVRRRLGISEEQRAIGMIARLVEQKNHLFMLKVLALDAAQGGNCVLVVVGDGPLRGHLEDRARALGLSDRVLFLGLRDDVHQILGALDIVAVPSFFEGLPVALVEAQAAGVPAVVSDSVTHESDLGLGLIEWLPLGDPAEWLRKLTSEFSRPAPSTIRERFEVAGYDVQSSATKLFELYTDHRSA